MKIIKIESADYHTRVLSLSSVSLKQAISRYPTNEINDEILEMNGVASVLSERCFELVVYSFR